MKSNLSNVMALFLLEIIEGSVNDLDVVLLVAFNTVGLDDLTTIGQNSLWNIVKCPITLKSQIHVSGGQRIYMEPNVIFMSIL